MRGFRIVQKNCRSLGSAPGSAGGLLSRPRLERREPPEARGSLTPSAPPPPPTLSPTAEYTGQWSRATWTRSTPTAKVWRNTWGWTPFQPHPPGILLHDAPDPRRGERPPPADEEMVIGHAGPHRKPLLQSLPGLAIQRHLPGLPPRTRSFPFRPERKSSPSRRPPSSEALSPVWARRNTTAGGGDSKSARPPAAAAAAPHPKGPWVPGAPF